MRAGGGERESSLLLKRECEHLLQGNSFAEEAQRPQIRAVDVEQLRIQRPPFVPPAVLSRQPTLSSLDGQDDGSACADPRHRCSHVLTLEESHRAHIVSATPKPKWSSRATDNAHSRWPRALEPLHLQDIVHINLLDPRACMHASAQTQHERAHNAGWGGRGGGRERGAERRGERQRQRRSGGWGHRQAANLAYWLGVGSVVQRGQVNEGRRIVSTLAVKLHHDTSGHNDRASVTVDFLAVNVAQITKVDRVVHDLYAFAVAEKGVKHQDH